MVLERRREGSVEILTLNRPEQRNALSPEMLGALSTAFAEAKDDDGVRVVILTGAGDRAFCAGMDLKAFVQQDGGERQQVDMSGFTEFSRGRFPKPVIGAANATAVAGGFELLMNCDLIVASEQARFGVPEVKRGLFPAGGGVMLPARIPLAVALELGLTGEQIDAARAYQLGLVNRVVPPDQVLPAALELAAKISENGPLGVQVTKQLMRSCMVNGIEATYKLQEQLHEKVFKSEDAMEGARAFAEKRTPVWKGR